MFFLFSSSGSSDFAYPKKPLPQTPEQSGELVPAVTVRGGSELRWEEEAEEWVQASKETEIPAGWKAGAC